jgi:hypothetical protein
MFLRQTSGNSAITFSPIRIRASSPGIASGYLVGGQNSAIELQFAGNGQWLPLSHEGTISAY